MLVYRSSESTAEAGGLLDALNDRVECIIERGAATHAACTDVLLDAAELETGVADLLCRDADDYDATIAGLRAMTRSAAAAFVSTSYGNDARALADVVATRAHLHALDCRVRRGRVSCSVPEGYAHYALYPETYIDAAERFARACAPAAATVIGIRTVGTSLASIVAATLATHGVDVCDATVRPRGHPFDRYVVMGPRLAALVRQRSYGWFLIVDEGPGISGSSFASAARALGEVGIADERIVFVPSWNPEPDILRNEHARARWRTHRRFVGSFDRLWIESGRLEQEWGGRLAGEWSAGKWRDALVPPGRPRPPVHPQHEQRKYVLDRPDGSRWLLKFNGLGRYGESRACVARRLAEQGTAPAVTGVAHGFIATELVDGHPLTVDELSAGDLAHAARYVAARPRATGRSSGATVDELARMVEVNVAERFGEHAAERASRIVRSGLAHSPPGRVVVDGRLQPHEWLRARTGALLKTDGNAHHDDHFYPGCQDAAWDVAGACVDLCENDEARRHLIDAYAAASGDSAITTRLPGWFLAYAAFRTGYTHLAAESLGDSADGRAMRECASRYEREIGRILGDGAP